MITLFLTDENMSYDAAQAHYQEANAWAQAHCESYQGCHVQDVVDFSMYNDLIAAYGFTDSQDACAFALKWCT